MRAVVLALLFASSMFQSVSGFAAGPQPECRYHHLMFGAFLCCGPDDFEFPMYPMPEIGCYIQWNKDMYPYGPEVCPQGWNFQDWQCVGPTMGFSSPNACSMADMTGCDNTDILKLCSLEDYSIPDGAAAMINCIINVDDLALCPPEGPGETDWKVSADNCYKKPFDQIRMD